MYEQKTHDLDYTNRSFEYLSIKLDKNAVYMDKQVPRRTQIPGVKLSGIDPTGDNFIDKALTGVNNEGYGLAAYRRGAESQTLLDFEKSQQSYFTVKEKKTFS